MTKSTLPTVRIGISALNEQSNIRKLVRSILSQDTLGFQLEDIVVVSDGSTDETVSEARAVKSSKVKVVEHSQRRGKSQRMAELFGTTDADVLVMFDADVVLDSSQTIEQLVDPILRGGASLASGRPLKIESDTKFDRLMDVSMDLQDYVKKNINHGDNVYACHGRIVALSRALYSSIAPDGIISSNDAYLYFANQQIKGKFVYVDSATVKFKMPQTEKDFIKQQARFAGGSRALEHVFGTEVAAQYRIPVSIYAKACGHVMARHGFSFARYFILRFKGKFARPSSHALWDVSSTTKKL
jgi:glycosyltransferase involved in cell wall biosynthesis